MSVLLKNAYSMPHGAVVFCGADLLNDFDAHKTVAAWRRRQREGTLGQDGAIWELEVHPTNVCNLQCPGCSSANRHDGRTIDLDKLIALVRHYGQFDLRSIFISGGGDPAFWKDWNRFVEHLPDPLLQLGVSTNLSTVRRMGSVLGRMSVVQVHVVGFDQMSVVKETGVDYFETIRRNLDLLFSARTATQQVTMKILMRDDNYPDLPMFLDFIAEYPCDAVVVKLCQDFQKNANLLRRSAVEAIRNLAISHPINERFAFVLDGLDDELYCLDDAPRGSCSLADSGLYRLVTADGAVFPCIASTYDEHNCCGRLTGDPDRPLVPTTGHLPPRINPQTCPRQACRHYRCSLVIDEAMQNPRHSPDDPHTGFHPEPVLL